VSEGRGFLERIRTLGQNFRRGQEHTSVLEDRHFFESRERDEDKDKLLNEELQVNIENEIRK
jgi:hypothetical protein